MAWSNQNSIVLKSCRLVFDFNCHFQVDLPEFARNFAYFLFIFEKNEFLFIF